MPNLHSLKQQTSPHRKSRSRSHHMPPSSATPMQLGIRIRERRGQLGSLQNTQERKSTEDVVITITFRQRSWRRLSRLELPWTTLSPSTSLSSGSDQPVRGLFKPSPRINDRWNSLGCQLTLNRPFFFHCFSRIVYFQRF